MKKLGLALLGLLFAFSAQAQSVQQSGSIVPGQIPYFVSNGIIGNGGNANDSPITSLGVTNSTVPGFCVSSGRQTAAGRQQLCLGAPLNSAAQITLQNYGTATPQNLQFVINGTTVTIPTGGSGFVQYSGALVSGHMPCFSGTAGLVIDCGVGAGAGTLNGLAYYSAAGTIGSTAAGTNGQIIVGQTGAAPLWKTVSGDATLSAAGAIAITGINGVTFPSSPSVGTVPYVSSTNTITYGTAPVTGGGTGAATFTAHGVLLGQGTSAVTSLVNASIGLCLLSQGVGSDPVFAACGSGAGTAGGSNTQVQFNNTTNLAGSANLTWVSPKLSIGVSGTTGGQVAIGNGSGSGQDVVVQNVSATSTYNFNLPATAGSSGQPLISGGGGGTGMSFGTLGIGGGGTNCASASGTCLDNITGFSGTGYMNRTGAGTYTFTPTFGVAQGGTGLASGTSGGILGFTGTTTLASSALLTQYGVVYGGGAGATPAATAAGATGTILTGSATVPVFTTATYPATAAANTILAAGSSNAITATATPTIGTSLAIAGCTIGTSAFCATGPVSTSGSYSLAAWTTSGARLKLSAASITDTSSSGTVAAAYTDLHGVGTILASSSTTYTNYFGAYFQDPVASTNVTMTNKWSLGADSMRIGTSNSLTVSTTGVLTATSPVLTTPSLGVATATSINGNTFTTGTYTLTGTAGKTLNFTNTLTLSGTDSTTMTFPSTNGTVAALNIADQTLSGGANVTSSNQGTKSSGTFTVDCGASPLQYITNGGAFTLAAPANDGSCIVRSLNNGSAGTITFSGFTVGSNVGDALTTTNTSAFAIQIWRINGVSRYLVSAYQ